MHKKLGSRGGIFDLFHRYRWFECLLISASERNFKLGSPQVGTLLQVHGQLIIMSTATSGHRRILEGDG
jgi:hypothetical protein